MKKRVVIFGVGDFSSLAWYVLTHESNYEVVAFTANAAHLPSSTHQGLPAVPFEYLASHFPPGTTELLIPLGPRPTSGHNAPNGLRAERYAQAKSAGYTLASWVSPRALTWPDLQLGDNTMVYEGAIIQPFARIGDDCILRSGCNISHHAVIEDHAFIAAGAVVAGGARVGAGVFLGLGAIVRDGVQIAPGCLVGAGAVVTADTQPDGLYVGVPAKRLPLPASD